MQGFVTLAGESHALTLLADGAGGYRSAGVGRVAADGTRWMVGERSGIAIVARHGRELWVHLDGQAYALTWQDAVEHFNEDAGGPSDSAARAPMPGAVVGIAVAAGDAVSAGDALLVIESMKLETTIRSPRDGVIQDVHVAIGETFERDALLVSLEPEA